LSLFSKGIKTILSAENIIYIDGIIVNTTSIKEEIGDDQSSTGMAEGTTASTEETVGNDQSSTGMAEGTTASTEETVGNDQSSTGMAEGTTTTTTESTLLRTSSTSITTAIRLKTSSPKFHFSLINYHFDKPNSYSPSDDENSYGL
jgi:hypothetical protein